MKTSGFTLIEILLVVTIMAILAGTGSYLAMGSRDKISLTTSYELLKSHLEEARANALYGKKPKGCDGRFDGVRFTVNGDKKGYEIVSMCTKVDGTPIEEPLVKNKFENNKIAFEAQKTIIFTPMLKAGITDGLGAAPSQNMTLTLTDNISTKPVDITPQGYIQIGDPSLATPLPPNCLLLGEQCATNEGISLGECCKPYVCDQYMTTYECQ